MTPKYSTETGDAIASQPFDSSLRLGEPAGVRSSLNLHQMADDQKSALAGFFRNPNLTPCLITALAFVLSGRPALAASVTVLHSFLGSPTDGAVPYFGSLIRDSAGNLYGTTINGGLHGTGTVFEVSGGTERVLHNFGGTGDGAHPYGGLVMDYDGNLYGTAATNGAHGVGVVFKLSLAGEYSLLHSFSTATGEYPYGSLVLDSSGNLYGTTYAGGSTGLGTVFRLAPTGTYTVLHTFAGGKDGARPYAGLVLGSSGNLYGTTFAGGGSNVNCPGGCGTVFEVTPSGNETVLLAFVGGKTDGAHPYAALIMDASGNLYGTTYQGGLHGQGTVFVLNPATSWVEEVLHSFSSDVDGAWPCGSLVLDVAGNVYGTTSRGGEYGGGIVFQLTPGGSETVFAQFENGAWPLSGLAIAGESLYGTTQGAGAYNQGTVFQIR